MNILSLFILTEKPLYYYKCKYIAFDEMGVSKYLLKYSYFIEDYLELKKNVLRMKKYYTIDSIFLISSLHF